MRQAPSFWFDPDQTPPFFFRAVSAVFGTLAAARRALFRLGLKRAERLPVPVIVVGNLTVGGSGKTPLTLHLARELVARGWQPGIVSRGYGGTATAPQAVTAASLAREVGDEPLLLARRSGVPVWIGADRAAAGRALLAANPAVNVLLCDDGLQHYALARDVEIAVFDGRGLGNGRLLPAGPLREPASRLRGVTAIVSNIVSNGEPAPSVLAAQAAAGAVPLFRMQLEPGEFYDLREPARRCTAADLSGQALVALAGIGDPRRFFTTVQALGLSCEERPFPDHHAYTAADLAVPAGAVLLLTEKDAVKCAPLLQAHAETLTAPVWVLPVEAALSPDLTAYLLEKLDGRSPVGNPGLPGLQRPAGLPQERQ